MNEIIMFLVGCGGVGVAGALGFGLGYISALGVDDAGWGETEPPTDEFKEKCPVCGQRNPLDEEKS